MRLQETVDPSGSAELALTAYQLGVLYYVHDMLQDAGSMVRGGLLVAQPGCVRACGAGSGACCSWHAPCASLV